MNCHLLSDSNRIIPSSSGYGRPTFQSIECYCNSCTGRLSSNWCFWNKGVLFSARITNEVSSSGTDLRSVHSINPFSFGTNSLFILATVCDKPMKNKSTNMIQHNGFYSCTYCLHPGESVTTANGGRCVVYPPPLDRSYRLRTELSYRSAVKRSKRSRTSVVESMDHS